MFRKRREGWVGVDRGAGSVKVAQLRRAGGELRVALRAVTPRWSHDGEAAITEDKRCRHELDTVRAIAGSWRTRQAAATASMDLCTLSTSDDYGGTKETLLCTDTWGAGEHERYKLSMPEEVVNTLCDGLRRAGLQCRVIDGAPLAIARALRLAPSPAPDALVAGLDWGVAGATLVAAKHGRAVYARKFKECGFRSVLESLASTLGLATSEVETLIRRHGVVAAQGNGVAATVARALADQTNALLTEARRTLSHLSAKLKTRGPEQLWGFGVGATPPGLTNLIGQRLGIPAEPWRPAAIAAGPSDDTPLCLFGQAIALSALAWEAQQ